MALSRCVLLTSRNLLPCMSASEKQVVKTEGQLRKLKSRCLGNAAGRQVFFKDISGLVAGKRAKLLASMAPKVQKRLMKISAIMWKRQSAQVRRGYGLVAKAKAEEKRRAVLRQRGDLAATPIG